MEIEVIQDHRSIDGGEDDIRVLAMTSIRTQEHKNQENYNRKKNSKMEKIRNGWDATIKKLD